MTDFKDMMKKAADAAKNGGGDFVALPPGKYIMKLTKCFRNKSKKGEGRNQTNLDWEVVEPSDQAGETHRSFHNLDHDIGLQICVADFAKMGFDLSGCGSLEEIDKYCATAEAMAPVFEISLVQKGDFLNTRLGACLGSSTPPEEQTVSAPAPTPAPVSAPVPDEAGVSLEVGSKVKYSFKGKSYIMPIKAVNFEAETIDTAMHKGISLSDILELME